MWWGLVRGEVANASKKGEEGGVVGQNNITRFAATNGHT